MNTALEKLGASLRELLAQQTDTPSASTVRATPRAGSLNESECREQIKQMETLLPKLEAMADASIVRNAPAVIEMKDGSDILLYASSLKARCDFISESTIAARVAPAPNSPPPNVDPSATASGSIEEQDDSATEAQADWDAQDNLTERCRSHIDQFGPPQLGDRVGRTASVMEDEETTAPTQFDSAAASASAGTKAYGGANLTRVAKAAKGKKEPNLPTGKAVVKTDGKNWTLLCREAAAENLVPAKKPKLSREQIENMSLMELCQAALAGESYEPEDSGKVAAFARTVNQ